MTQYVEWDALANILIFGLLIGAGLPTLFALGVRALAGPGSRDDAGRTVTWRVAAAVACFAIVIAAIVGAIIYIAAGGH
ncbi:hypothetical protein [Demequina salsinemoris]|uniref:hypothetical protein n=1 Tax=Demequina salsinemoris TaxID=577470 RepID=UPI0007827EE6|nr:hypothetical protein [Demequina salsinemoris]